jgi:hypothetical protein
MRFLTLVLLLGFYSGTAQGKMGYRSVFFTIPLVETGSQSTAHLEFNLWGEAGLAFEGTYIHRANDVTEKEAIATNDDYLETHGRQFAVLISRYSEPMDLGGFYWTIGAGYREIESTWVVNPTDDDMGMDMSLVNDDDGKLYHDATMSGVTGHGRLGYRYIGTSYPVVIGSYFGLRHYASGVEDVVDGNGRVADGNAPMTDYEKIRLSRRFQTRPEISVEMGWAF